MSENVISLEEVDKHNKPNSLWLVIEGYVHNLTEYQVEHPGGGNGIISDDILMNLTGKDATEAFVKRGHS